MIEHAAQPAGRLPPGRGAEVEPRFETYDGDDPNGYALAVNMGRRNMTKGQQAVVLARAYKDYTEEDRRTYGVSKQYVSWARQVLIHASELADLVLSGARGELERCDPRHRGRRDRPHACDPARWWPADLIVVVTL